MRETTTSLPPDQAARDRIVDDLGATLFIEAGAGAGKTRSLVDRVVQLVLHDVPITAIAAITFTEKAAAELRHRVRGALETLPDPRAVQAAADLDHAPIGTLHSFARRILNEFPIETGLPPGFRVLDALESDMHFDEEWEEFLDDLLDDPEPPGGIVEGGSALVDLVEFDKLSFQRDLKEVAKAFRWNWDLVDARVDLASPPPFELDLSDLVTEMRSICTTPVPPDDTQAARLDQIGAFADRMGQTSGLLPALRALDEAAGKLSSGRTTGNKAKWREHGGEEALQNLRDRQDELAARLLERLDEVKAYRKRVLGTVCGRFVLDRTAHRAEAGTLEFHDLLVRARQLLARDPGVRSSLHSSYRCLLLDEFQDTDPIQLEIAVRIAAAPDDPAHHTDWTELQPLPGRLFIVGDPKQSIYRFRRADIAQYLRTPRQIHADVEHLSANFRSTAQVIGASNELFDSLIRFADGAQPEFQPLTPCRVEEARGHGSVTMLGAEFHDDLAGQRSNAEQLRSREAADVVGAVTTALAERWPVWDRDDGRLRPCRPGDICILLPTRLSLAALEREMRAAELPYRAENSSIVYSTAEIRDLLLALRAADDPTDELAIVEALRGPLYGCSDVELWEWRSAGGSWGPWRTPPSGYDDHPVAEGLRHLASVKDRASTMGAAELLAAIVDERRLEDLALDGIDHRDVWHRIRFVVDQARAWADAGGRGVRRYLQWAARQASDGQVAEAILPEQDRDAVRLMTVHAAKGLEFPITVVSGLTTQPRRVKGVQVSWEGAGWHLSGKADDGSFAEVAPIDELMTDAERRRLLYVACTRAVDHLVVSLHRAVTDEKLHDKSDDRCTSAELLAKHGAARCAEATTRSFDVQAVERSGPSSSRPADDLDEWRHERDATIQRAGRRSAIAATRLAEEVMARAERDLDDDPGLDKQPVNLDLPPWQRGRYGTSIGRAVHGTLQFCDLADGADIGLLAQSQCAAEGILTMSGLVADLARSAITAPIVRRVVDGAPHWRELFVAAPVGDRILEGYVDLLVRTPDGLVIVDYKTDRWSGPVQTAERVGRYRIQLAAYGAALEVALGEPIVGGILVRCRAGDTAEQIMIPDWADAVRSVDEAVRQ